MNNDLVNSFVEVSLTSPNTFLPICESLTRMGVTDKANTTLYQSCHLLHKRGKYYLCHYKDMLALDGHATNISEEDIQRRNKIAALLEQWKLLTVVDPSKIADQADISKVKVISFADKNNYKLVKKYSIGRKH